MKYTLIALLSLILLATLFGCTVSVNPTDLNPAKKYTPSPDLNKTTNTDQNTASTTPQTPDNNKVQINLSASEVAKHTQPGDCWMIINSNVYDLSQFVNHPGGSIYLNYCGMDATQGYDTKGGRGNTHSSFANQMLAAYLIGPVGQTITTDTNSPLVNPQNNTNTNQTQYPRNPREYWDD